MNRIYITSDLHFGHNKDFLFKHRGFSSIEEHDNTVIKNWNEIVNANDTVQILGDLMLEDNKHGVECLQALNGKFHIILGNHDTETRKRIYAEMTDKVIDIQYATIIKYQKQRFYLSHYPTLTSNTDRDSFSQTLINLSGHTHKKEKFFNDLFFIYNVALDAHDNKPVSLDQIIEDCKEKIKAQKDF